ncbi:MAG: hypothetical protein ACREYE_02410, partial [Gammaproteobacteria bacterium]
MMERIFETMDLMNVDFQNDRARRENRAIAMEQGLPPAAGENKAFERGEPVVGRPLPLTERGRERHRRFVSLEVFEDILREQPDLIERIIREPMTGDRYYDRRMPAVMRGSEFVKKPTALGISRSGGARNPHVFQYTLRFLRSGGTRPSFA